MGLTLVALGCSPEPTCDADELASRLAAASPGHTVEVGACRIEGSFLVPAGVTLVGQGAASTTIASIEPLATALDVVPGLSAGQPSVVRELAIEHDGGFGVRSAGSGFVELHRLDVRSLRGVGIGAMTLDGAVIEDVVATGPVTAANAPDLGDLYDAIQTATFGIALLDVEDAQLARVALVGYAEAGLLASRTGLTWTEGAADANLGTGIRIVQGTAALTDVTASDTLRGFRGVPSYGVYTADAALTTTRLVVERAQQGFGLMHVGGDVAHTDLVASEHGSTGVMAQFMDAFRIDGEASTIADNRFAGVLVVDSPGATIEDATIDATAEALGLPSGFTAVTMGDGIQLVRSTAGTRIANVALSGNERVGVLVDLGTESTDGLDLGAVTVSGTGDALGVVAQNGTVTDGWDAMVERTGDVLTNDSAFADLLDVADSVGMADLPSAEPLMRAERDGLDGIVAPCD